MAVSETSSGCKLRAHPSRAEIVVASDLLAKAGLRNSPAQLQAPPDWYLTKSPAQADSWHHPRQCFGAQVQPLAGPGNPRHSRMHLARQASRSRSFGGTADDCLRTDHTGGGNHHVSRRPAQLGADRYRRLGRRGSRIPRKSRVQDSQESAARPSNRPCGRQTSRATQP